MSHVLDAEQLLAECQASDEQSRAEAYQQLGELLYRMLLRRVGRDPRVAHLAADCAQEAIVTIWQRLESGHGPDRPASFVSWSARIAVNKLRDEQRRLEPQTTLRRSKRVGLSRQVRLDAEDDDGHSMSERLADSGPADVDAAIANEELRDLVLEINDLGIVSDKSKTVLLRGYLGGWDDAELADLLGTSKNNVHVIRCRDLAKLRADDPFMQRLRRGLAAAAPDRVCDDTDRVCDDTDRVCDDSDRVSDDTDPTGEDRDANPGGGVPHAADDREWSRHGGGE